MSAAAKCAHFTITGEDVTRILRDFMLSEEPARAERLLAEGLQGDMTPKMMKGLCAGTMRLVGDESSMEIEDDDGRSEATRSYLKDLRFIYAGRVRVDRRWWRPRAWVSDLGMEDARYATKSTGMPIPVDLPEGRGAMLRYGKARVSFYARPEERVFEVGKVRLGKRKDGTRPQPGFVIFEPVGEPPSWWPISLTPEAALVEFLRAGRKLDEDAHSSRYRDVPVDREVPFVRGPPTEEEKRAREAEEDARESVFLAECARIADAVREQAGGDVLLLSTEDGRSWQVPRAPFEQWALGRTALRHLAAPWKTIAQSGMKLQLDDPNHTDWMLGSGIGISHEAYYDEAIRAASTDAQFAVQERLGSFQATVVVDGGAVDGTVGKDVLVLRDMRPEHVEAMRGARAVIAEVGGAGAHLAQVAAEHSKTVMVVPGAVARYPRGTKLSLFPAEGRIAVREVHRPLGRSEDEDGS